MHFHNKRRYLNWIIAFITASLILATILTFKHYCFGMGKKPIIGLSLADQMKAADTIKGIDSKIDKVEGKIDAQLTAVAGVNNQVSKVSSEIKSSSGRDTNVNDSKLMSDYIEAMKSSHKEVADTLWKIISLLIIQLIAVISAFGYYLFFTVKYLLQSDRINDALIMGRKSKKGGKV